MDKRKRIVAGNWKMNGTMQSTAELLTEIINLLHTTLEVECIVFPPSVYLLLASGMLKNTSICWGAQNVFPKDAGAFTGEVSGLMIKEFDCQYVMVGHSERRHFFQESEKFVADKFHHVKEHGMIPLLCIGETQAEREAGLTMAVLKRQLEAVATSQQDAFSQCVIAYEPVWAIGTGLTPQPEEVQEIHQGIRQLIAGLGSLSSLNIPLLYGGSVTEKNAKAFFEMPDVDGGLIGGASLNAQQFVEIFKCIN